MGVGQLLGVVAGLQPVLSPVRFRSRSTWVGGVM